MRLCLHDNPQADHHDTIILAHKGKYNRPHKHKGEAFHVIEGELAVFAFSEDGLITDSVLLHPSEIYRVEAGMYHAIQPISETVIYHKNKPGPFLGDSDSIFEPWSPDFSQHKSLKLSP